MSEKINWQSHAGAWIFFSSYALLAAIYYFYLHMHIPDVPQVDDYRAILKPLIAWAEDKSATNFFVQLFSQHNEHKILIVKLASIFFYELEESVNFKHLILAGNVFFSAFSLIFFVWPHAAAVFFFGDPAAVFFRDILREFALGDGFAIQFSGGAIRLHGGVSCLRAGSSP